MTNGYDSKILQYFKSWPSVEVKVLLMDISIKHD